MGERHFQNHRRIILVRSTVCGFHSLPWHNMMTSSNGNIIVSLAICAGNSPVTGEFPAQRPVTQSFDVYFDLRLNKRSGKRSWGWWFETPSRSLWCHCHDRPEPGRYLPRCCQHRTDRCLADSDPLRYVPILCVDINSGNKTSKSAISCLWVTQQPILRIFSNFCWTDFINDWKGIDFS